MLSSAFVVCYNLNPEVDLLEICLPERNLLSNFLGEQSTSKKSVQVKSTKVVKDAILPDDIASERRKSSRALTGTSSEMHRERMEKKHKVGKKQVKFSQARRLTQKEVMAEAKITEEQNSKSLKDYQQREESKKTTKNRKQERKEAKIS